MAEPPQIGEPAPDFTLPTDDGGVVSLSQLKGKSVVLYFYPKDDTPGCTTEAVDFTAQADAFAAVGATVIGVSPDDAASHQRFKAKHDLTVTLASDPERRTIEAYGAWGEKKLYGKTSMGLIRSTFLISPDGVVTQAWRNIRVKGHVAKVLAAAQEAAR